MNQSLDMENSVAMENSEQIYKVWRERFIQPLLFGVLLFGSIALFPALSASQSIWIDAIFIGTYLITAISAIFKFSYNIRIAVFLAGIYVLALGELISLGILGDSLFYFLALVVFATMLHSPKAGITAIAAGILAIAVVGWFMIVFQTPTLFPDTTPAKLADWISAGAALMMFGIVIIYGFRQLDREITGVQTKVTAALYALREERNNLDAKVQERTLQLRRINEVGRAVAAILDINEILPFTVKHIQNEFGFYYTAIYLLDSSGQWIELKEAAGEAGKIMKEKKHRIHINTKGLIAQAVRSKTGQIMQDASQIRLDNPMFPYTRSLIAIPLVVGDTVFGALEMHSSKEGEFLLQDLDAYQNMANGISISIENSRLYEDAQQSITEMRATQRQYLESAWTSLASERSLQYALGDADMAASNPLEVPLALRNQIIGQILTASESEWTSEQKSLIESIATQASLALENARLVEQSQFTASHERLTNEIISKIWASPNMDAILQTTVRELGRNLEASEVEIEISMDGLNEE